jgi:hypothetical protein
MIWSPPSEHEGVVAGEANGERRWQARMVASADQFFKCLFHFDPWFETFSDEVPHHR